MAAVEEEEEALKRPTSSPPSGSRPFDYRSLGGGKLDRRRPAMRKKRRRNRKRKRRTRRNTNWNPMRRNWRWWRRRKRSQTPGCCCGPRLEWEKRGRKSQLEKLYYYI